MLSKSRCRIWVVGALLCGLTLGADPVGAQEKPYVWQTVPFGGGGLVDGFVFHPKEKGLLYARTDMGGLYRYDPSGAHWVQLLDHLGHDDADLMGVISVALDPNDPNRVCAATGLYLPDWAHKGAILCSPDRGTNWSKADLPIHVGGNADGRGSGERLAFDPKDGDVLYYGSNRDGLWKSTNGGRKFAKQSSAATAISLVLIDPKNRDVYIGKADGAGGLLVSHDGGESFASVPGAPELVPQHAAFAPDGTLYVSFAGGEGDNAVNPSYATKGGVYKRTPNGTWTDITPDKPDASRKFGYSALDIAADGTLAAGTLNRWWPGDDIFVSKDGGEHWKALSGASRHDGGGYPWFVAYSKGEDKMGHWIADLKIDPFDANRMVYVTGYGVWMSRNFSAVAAGGKVTFDFAVKDLEETATMQLAVPTGGAHVLAALGDVGGAAWFDTAKTPDVGLFVPESETNYSIDYAPANPAFLARLTNSDATHGFYSEDGGKSWKAFAASPYRTPSGGEAWRSPGTLAVSARGTSMLWVPQKDVGYFSTDKGAHWTKSAGFPSATDPGPVTVSDKGIDGVYYVLDRSRGDLLISVDGGASFTVLVGGLPKGQPWETIRMAAVPGRMRDVWIATPFSLIHSRDPASPFADFKAVTAAWAVGFGAPKVKGGYPAVYLSGKVKGKEGQSQEGLWRSDDEGATWVRINDDAHRFGSVLAISGDMREYGLVYIAPGGRGVMVGHPAGEK